MSAPFGRLSGKPLDLVNPRDLSEHELRALRIVSAGHCKRTGGGYAAIHGPRVSCFYALVLEEKGLARVDNGELVLTGSGRWTLQLADEAAGAGSS